MAVRTPGGAVGPLRGPDAPGRRGPGDTPGVQGVSAIVLAGGRSSRFGADKLAASMDGRPLLQHAIDAVARVADEVIVVLAAGARRPIPWSRRPPPSTGRSVRSTMNALRRAPRGPAGGAVAARTPPCWWSVETCRRWCRACCVCWSARWMAVRRRPSSRTETRRPPHPLPLALAGMRRGQPSTRSSRPIAVPCGRCPTPWPPFGSPPSHGARSTPAAGRWWISTGPRTWAVGRSESLETRPPS